MHVRPDLPQPGYQVLQIGVSTHGSVGGAVPQADHHHLVVVGVGEDQREIRILAEVAVEQRQLLVAVRRVVPRTKVVNLLHQQPAG
jgi:hypothetical protein